MVTIGIAIIVAIAIIAAMINCLALTIRAQVTSEETQETENEQNVPELELLDPSGASCIPPLNFSSAGQQTASNQIESEQNMTELESSAQYECNP
jgi:hypothetical protein